MSILNCQHSVVELKAADSRAVRLDAIVWKAPHGKVLGFLCRPHYLRTHHVRREYDKGNRNKVLPEIPAIVDNAESSDMIASKVYPQCRF